MGTVTLTFNNNTYYNTGAYALTINQATGDADTTLVYKNNIFYKDTVGGVAALTINTPTSCPFTYQNNCAYNCTAVPTGTGNITTDPLFVDLTNSNFNLRPTSPCIDGGVLI
jgi:hypothetical protein